MPPGKLALAIILEALMWESDTFVRPFTTTSG